QFYVMAEDRNNKVDAVLEIIADTHLPHTLIFVNSQKDALSLAEALNQHGFGVDYLHAGLGQDERNEVMRKFRQSEAKILITTNLISRGIDVQSVALVINFDMPKQNETYIHRIGRSGRYGRKGMAINLIVEEDMKQIKELEVIYHTSILEMPSNYKDFF
ncbi:hypothetical protein HZS_6001, partial [Henneguya salminicola]